MNEQEKQPKTWGTYVARVLIVLFFAGVLFMLSTPLISKYNQTHYTMRSCTVTEATARETRTVTTSTKLSIYTSDCGTLVYEISKLGAELERMAEHINEFQGKRLGFGFGDIQLQSNLSTVFKVEGTE
ncbi:hypothetical protein [Rothia terrae]|uniref:hypothetical protein n=1 Tax=Rothia terrae TaxID=396015 RepID=UPI0028825FAB|nr:hypothetical protein [Rothia terrae]MDT0190788.1 hypothetical protein [Rothia terrae]